MRADFAPLPAPRALRSIVVGTDFSPCSKGAVSQALRLAERSGASLHVVHVVDVTVVVEIEASLSDYQKEVREGLVRGARDAWRVLASAIPGAEALPIDVAIDNRIAGILRHARGCRADLLVLGAFGDRSPDVGFGTVASACVRTSASDVLLVRDAHAGPFRAVVAAVDFSETSSRALELAARLAAADGAELHVLHAWTDPWRRLRHDGRVQASGTSDAARHRESLQRRLAELASALGPRHPSLRAQVHVVDAHDRRSAIVEHARGVGADLVVLGTRGASDLHDALLGSTAERVLAESPCSILAVKPGG